MHRPPTFLIVAAHLLCAATLANAGPLHDALAAKQYGELARLLDAGADFTKELDGSGANALDWAVLNGDDDAVAVLLKHSRAGLSVFQAAGLGRIDALREAIAAGGDVNDRRADYVSPLVVAVKRGQIEAVRELLSHGADVEAYAQGWTPLLNAVASGRSDMVAALLDAGAHPNAEDGDGYKTPLRVARERGLGEIEGLLEGRGGLDLQKVLIGEVRSDAMVDELWVSQPSPMCVGFRGHRVFVSDRRNDIEGFSVPPDGSRIALACGDGRLRLLSPEGVLLEEVDLHTKLFGTKPRDGLGSWEPAVFDVDFGPFNDRAVLGMGYSSSRDTSNGGFGYIAEYSFADGSLRVLSPECAGLGGEAFDPNRFSNRQLRYGLPSLSPDGKMIVFTLGVEVFTAEYPSMEHMTLITAEVDQPNGGSRFLGTQPRWSPDGKLIAVALPVMQRTTQGAQPREAVYLLRPDGGNPRSLYVAPESAGRITALTWWEGSLCIIVSNGYSGRRQIAELMLGEDGCLRSDPWFTDMAERTYGTMRSVGAPMLWTRLARPDDREGTLTVNCSSPAAKIYLDGALTGKTAPCTFSVKAGPHTVEVRSVLGESKIINVVTKPGQEAQVAAEF